MPFLVKTSFKEMAVTDSVVVMQHPSVRMPNSSVKNAVNGFVIQIQLTADHCDCQKSIRPHDSPHFGHIFLRF
jgi:hypothetical protein